MKSRKTLVLTSIPPKMLRIDSDGADIGFSYLEHCVSTWRNSGFSVLSVNTSDEQTSNASWLNSLLSTEEQVIVHRSASRMGKAVPYLGDMLNAVLAFDFENLVLTNADIMFEFNQADLNIINSLGENSAIALRRIDVCDMSEVAGEEFQHGYDFFAIKRSTIRQLTSCSFAFGMPWWDHFLPVWMALSGIKHNRMTGFGIKHLNHSERWEWNNWREIGRGFVSSVEKSFHGHQKNKSFLDYMSKARLVHKAPGRRNIPLYAIKKLHPSLRKKMLEDELYKFSNLNIATIENWRKIC